MRRVVALVAIAGLAVGLAFALRPSAGQAAVRAGRLTVSVPGGFNVYPIHAGFCRAGTEVIGQVLTDFHLPAHACIDRVLKKWVAMPGNGPPSNVVALELKVRGLGPVGYELALPLSLHQPWPREPWANEHFASGVERYGALRATDMDYDVMYWSGQDAPANDRAAVLGALRSIRPTR